MLGRQGRRDQVGGAVPVGVEVLGLGARGHRARDVIDHVLAGAGRPQGLVGVEVAAHEREARPLEGGGLGGTADEGRDAVAPRAEGVDQVAADESRRAGDERLHTARSYRRYVS